MTKKLIKFKDVFISVLLWISGLVFFIPFGTSILFLSIFVNPRYFDKYIKGGCRLLIRFLCIRVTIEGLDHFQEDQTYLFMSNHVNLFDVFVLYGYIPNFVRGVELDDHFQWPFYGILIRRLGMIPISHTNPRKALKSLQAARHAIDEETSIIILPEGGRTLDGKFKPFKRGTFLLAKDANVDIVPMVMIDAYQINRKGSLLIRPGKMKVRFGEPIAWDKIKEMEVNEIKSFVRQKMKNLFNQ